MWTLATSSVKAAPRIDDQYITNHAAFSPIYRRVMSNCIVKLHPECRNRAQVHSGRPVAFEDCLFFLALEAASISFHTIIGSGQL